MKVNQRYSMKRLFQGSYKIAYSYPYSFLDALASALNTTSLGPFQGSSSAWRSHIYESPPSINTASDCQAACAEAAPVCGMFVFTPSGRCHLGEVGADGSRAASVAEEADDVVVNAFTGIKV